MILIITWYLHNFALIKGSGDPAQLKRGLDRINIVSGEQYIGMQRRDYQQCSKLLM